MERFLITFLKGVWLGGTLTVPGVSGGTMAIVIGVYERILQAVNRLKERKNILFLFTIGSGGLLGVVALSGVVSQLLRYHYTAMAFFFVGAVAGGVPSICSEMRSAVFKLYQSFYFLCGVGIVCLTSMLSEGLFALSLENSVLMQILGGFIAAVALVLPGISVSHMLYVMGIYKSLMTAIASFEVLLLIPFLIGLFAGVFLTARLVDYLLTRFKTEMYLMILGFVIGSIGEMLFVMSKSLFSPVHVLLSIAGFLPLWVLYKKKKADA